MSNARAASVRLLPLLLLGACAWLSKPYPQPPTPQPQCVSLGSTSFTLTGIVQEENGDRPLPGSTVRVIGSSRVAVSDSSGAYRISRLPIGTHVVEASRVGYYREQREITVHDADILRLCASGTGAVLRFHMRPQSLP